MEPERAVPPPAASARKGLERQGPALLVRALALLESAPMPAVVPEGIAAPLWAVAGLGAALAAALAEAQAVSGRAVCETIFALHALFGHGTGQAAGSPSGTDAETKRQAQLLEPHLKIYLPWARSLTAREAAWRTLGLRWVDTLSERLTMHRYGDPARRRLHAQALLAAPLRQIFAEAGAPLPASATQPLDLFCEHALSFWDLRQAGNQAARGWNRIAAPDPGRLGGFFGLGDEAVPPAEAEIRQAAETLLATLDPAPPFDPTHPAGRWLNLLHAALRADLRVFLDQGVWPEPPRHPPAGFWHRLRQFF